MRRVLVTGAGTWIGSRLVATLERLDDTTVFPVVGRASDVPFHTEAAEIDLEDLALARHVLEVRPHVVVHLPTPDRHIDGPDPHAAFAIGSRSLAGAIGRYDGTRHVVVGSDGAWYGAGPRHPSICDEDSEPQGEPGRRRRQLLDLERLFSELALDRPDVTVTILRPAPVFGATVGNPISALLRKAVVPSLAGFDPRLQFLHEDDAAAVFLHAAAHPVAGTFNVAAPGQMYLSRVLRLGRRVHQPLPGPIFRRTARRFRTSGVPISNDMLAMLQYGRVLDATGMHRVLGFSPALTCRQTVLAAYERVPLEAAG